MKALEGWQSLVEEINRDILARIIDGFEAGFGHVSHLY